jgi:hypothetical protein
MLVLLFGAGCGSKEKQDARVEQLQAQLDQTRQELQTMKEDADQQRAKIDQQRSGAPRQPDRRDPGAMNGNTGKSVAEADLAAAKAAGKKAIEEDRAAIASNQTAIEENRERIARAEAAAEEAKRLAAPPPTHTIPSGTALIVRTTNLISTKTSATGSTFEATLEEPLSIDGYLVADKGATVEGVVTNADPGGRVKGVASISVSLRSLVTNDGRRLPLRTDVAEQQAKKSTGKDAKRLGIATGVGAAIGAIAGGGRGAAIGAGVGAAGGTGVAMATRGEAAEIPSETVLNFKLAAPVQIQELRK